MAGEPMIGKEYVERSLVITRTAVALWCRGVGETNPLYLDRDYAKRKGFRDQLVPPSFAYFFVWGVIPESEDDMVITPYLLDGRPSFYAQQGFNFYKLMTVGDICRVKARIAGTEKKVGRRLGNFELLRYEVQALDQDGEKVLDGTTWIALREKGGMR